MRSAILLLSVLAACSYTGSTLAPYSRDVSAAAALQRRAANACLTKRGADLPHAFFTTDGCSMWPDDGWAECCVSHDITYWCGGSAEDRASADVALERCVATDASQALGDVMHAGSRVGGVPWAPLPWRWGYGYPWPRGYEEVGATATGAPAP